MKAWIIPAGCTEGFQGLRLTEHASPVVGPGQVRVAMKAWSSNYRDLVVPLGQYFTGPVTQDTVPLSDGAGVIVEIGEGVSEWQLGDRVVGTFFQNWQSGVFQQSVLGSDLGGPIDGMLAEEVVLPERGLIRIPENLTYEEAATLPCAAVTAWHSLVDMAAIQPGQTVLTIGSGGVSVFAIQLAKSMGATVISTSSSNEKLEQLRQLGVDETINYKDTPEWDEEVLKLTGGRGVNTVLEVGGPGTLARSMNAVAVGGSIGLIGVLTGIDGRVNPLSLVAKAIRLQGIYVGSRSMFQAMINTVEVSDIHPIINRKFQFDEAPKAYAHQASGTHLGKVVISLG
jgi:NADPH:quinone reductase-like Zn-dependent oxidoreductase